MNHLGFSKHTPLSGHLTWALPGLREGVVLSFRAVASVVWEGVVISKGCGGRLVLFDCLGGIDKK